MLNHAREAFRALAGCSEHLSASFSSARYVSDMAAMHRKKKRSELGKGTSKLGEKNRRKLGKDRSEHGQKNCHKPGKPRRKKSNERARGPLQEEAAHDVS